MASVVSSIAEEFENREALYHIFIKLVDKNYLSDFVDEKPLEALVLAIAAVGESQIWLEEVPITVENSLKNALHVARERQIFEGGSLVSSPDGQYLVRGNQDGTVQFWHQQGWPITPPIATHGSSEVVSIVISANSQYVITSSSTGNMQIWNRQIL